MVRIIDEYYMWQNKNIFNLKINHYTKINQLSRKLKQFQEK